MESYHILSHRNASCRNGKEQNRTYRVELNWFESEWIGWYRAGSAHGNVETDPSIAVQQALTPLSGFVGRTLLVLFSYIYIHHQSPAPLPILLLLLLPLHPCVCASGVMQIDAESARFAQEKEALSAESAETMARLEHAAEEIETLKVGKHNVRRSPALVFEWRLFLWQYFSARVLFVCMFVAKYIQ